MSGPPRGRKVTFCSTLASQESPTVLWVRASPLAAAVLNGGNQKKQVLACQSPLPPLLLHRLLVLSVGSDGALPTYTLSHRGGFGRRPSHANRRVERVKLYPMAPIFLAIEVVAAAPVGFGAANNANLANCCPRKTTIVLAILGDDRLHLGLHPRSGSWILQQ